MNLSDHYTLLLQASKEVVREHYHRHTDRCWGAYEPCGEHHMHDDKCGSRRLICRKRESSRAINRLHDVLETEKHDWHQVGWEYDDSFFECRKCGLRVSQRRGIPQPGERGPCAGRAP